MIQTQLRSSDDSASSRLIAVFFVVALAAIVLHVLLVFVFPGRIGPAQIFGRTWGFHFLKYFSLRGRIFFYTIAVAALIPPVNNAVFGLMRAACAWALPVVRARKQELFVFVSLASFPVFWLLSCKYAFLGDAIHRVDNIINGEMLPDESGTILALHYLYLLANKVLRFDGMTFLVTVTNLLGAVFVYLALRIADGLGSTLFRKIALFAATIAFGTIQHFFGYVEIYAPLVVLLAATLLATLSFIQGKSSPVVPSILLAVTGAIHLIGIMFVPAFLLVLYVKISKKKPLLKNRYFIGALAVTLLAVSVYPFLHVVLPRCLPLHRGPGDIARMTMFSPAHIWEFLNGEVLAHGIGLFALPALLLYAVVKRRTIDGNAVYLLATFVIVGGAIFMFDEMFGSADWDIYSVLAIAGAPLVMYLFLVLFDIPASRRAARYGAVVLVAFLVIHTASWIIVNATNKSIGRFEDVLMNDPASYYMTHPAPMVVGIGLESNGLIERSRALERKAYEMFPSDPRILNNYAAGLCSQGKENEAMSIYSRLFNQYPYYTQPLKQVYQLLLRQKNTEMAGKVLQRIYEVYREAPSFLTGRYSTGEIASYVSAYADVLGSRGEWKRELPVCSTLVQIDNKQPQYPAMLAECLLELGDNDGAIARCRDVVTRWPAYPYGYYVGAEALKRKGLADDAVEMLRQCSRAAPVQAQITGILPSTRATQR